MNSVVILWSPLSPQASNHQESSFDDENSAIHDENSAIHNLNSAIDDFNSAGLAPPLLTVKHYGIGILSSGLKMIVLGFSL